MSNAPGPLAVKKKVFIVDDHPIFRLGVEKLIESEPDLEVCGDAGDAVEALDALRRVPADAVVVDISLPGTDGIELCKNIRAEHPKLPLLVISAHDEREYGLRTLRSGASGYLMKRESEALLCTALRRVLGGGIWVSPSFGQQLIYRVCQGPDGGDSPLDTLSDREFEVLRLAGSGKSTRDIATMLNLSAKTIESHRLHIRDKLGLTSSTDLIQFATDWVRSQQG